MSNLINLVIPCAGHSKRFFEEGYIKHKPFLPLENNLNIISKILYSFDKKFFKFHLVFTFEQYEIYESEILYLKKIFDSLEIHKIKEHTLGPTYSVQQIDIPLKEPLIVHYCDFLTRFDHKELIEVVLNGNIAAPYFSGFHPASLGTTNFAYMILDSTGELINLQEKKPFTLNRIDEPASTGIYGFPSFGLFLNLAENLFRNKNELLNKEAYTSLLLNEALDIGLKVKCSRVKNFICLGTPRDYKEYLFWNNIFQQFNSSGGHNYKNDYHLITAAGHGSRFKKKNYRLPKIFNSFFDATLLELSIKSLKGSITNIILLKDLLRYTEILKNLQLDFKFYSIDITPNGQLVSLDKLIQRLNLDENYSFYVSSADYNFAINNNKFKKFVKKNNPDIVIFSTKWNFFAHESKNNYGFVKFDSNNKIFQIIEKPALEEVEFIPEDLLIGTFWFKNKGIIKDMPFASEDKESFIASSINKVVNKFKVYNFPVDYWLSLGTPKELNLAKYWFDYFKYE